MLKFVDEYRKPDMCRSIAGKIREISTKRINIMEVCGGHTSAIRKNGIHKMIGNNIKLISGPGCPVCVTSIADIDSIIGLAKKENTAICTFGDLFYVPGTGSSLSEEKAAGADIRIVYSAHDVLNFAKEERNKNFVFISIGFETTAPTAAAALIEAEKKGLKNFYIFSLNKTMPHALKAVLENKNSKINALICPGHVSTITGKAMYDFIADDLKIPCCISGFEPADILSAIYILTELCEKETPKLINAYKRAVYEEGNKKAKDIMNKVFEASGAIWRGIGKIPLSGLKIRKEFKEFDAEKKFNIQPTAYSMRPTNCICGEILIGAKKPADCGLFGDMCTPNNPKGACMVSSEGACHAWHKYGE